ncbi:hypothetical protein EVAR_92230_1 [Eumeta japonica]|uniref:Uncharacterized protein n=1 Tax=Eumeta variegata TaxID=151549 RepID=A0A4C1TNH1_EUMVA|nr:hypothetical protein EVAR_92230_1 [Eumeta japonica]
MFVFIPVRINVAIGSKSITGLRSQVSFTPRRGGRQRGPRPPAARVALPAPACPRLCRDRSREWKRGPRAPRPAVIRFAVSCFVIDNSASVPWCCGGRVQHVRRGARACRPRARAPTA